MLLLLLIVLSRSDGQWYKLKSNGKHYNSSLRYSTQHKTYTEQVGWQLLKVVLPSNNQFQCCATLKGLTELTRKVEVTSLLDPPQNRAGRGGVELEVREGARMGSRVVSSS